ncbi:amidoligase family protein [Desulfohalovibrio reitneri]|uniref:amidoligase family protein n=1 Tax=Desulfohalovibrio reitneri TaxID=1307759 RepID=UPI0005583410|nr:amidoligase family protein [Desulfohalovibrio reitneri]
MSDFPPPPRRENAEGNPRRAGFEIEFAGVDLPEAARAVAEVFGGEVKQENEFAYRVTTEMGEFQVELDSHLIRHKRYEHFLSKMGIDLDGLKDKKPLEQTLRSVSSEFVPTEVVSPPLPMDGLAPLDELREKLRGLGAEGTKASPFFAFGMQINPEAPALDAETILAYLRAFLLLFDYIRKQADIDLSRRVSPFVDPFPDRFTRRFIDPAYDPDSVDGLIRDYLQDNPTRNRPLDCLPLFAHINEDLVHSFDVEHHLIKPRPAFHYRLPDCRIDDPDWTIAMEWSRWLLVERLADDPDRIRTMSQAYLDMPGFPMELFSKSWAEKAEAFLA